MKKVEVIILAAGKGTRMKSITPKILLKINGRTILNRVLITLRTCGIFRVNFVLGYGSDLIKKQLPSSGLKIKCIIQKKLNGTAKGLEAGLSLLDRDTQHVLVLFGDDSGLYNHLTLKSFIEYHLRGGNIGSFLVLEDERVSDIGSLNIDKDMNVIGVKTLSEMKSENLTKAYILCGAFLFDRKWIEMNIGKIEINPLSKEYPLPQISKVAINEGGHIKAFLLKNSWEWESVNTADGLKKANKKAKYGKKRTKKS